MDAPPLNRSPRRTAAALCSAGLLLALLAAAGVHPMAALLRPFSPDGELSAALRLLLARSQLVAGLALAAGAAAAFAARRHAGRWPQMLLRPAPAAFAAGLAAAGLVLAVFLQQVLFDGIPHVTDATSHAFQARIFRLGRFAVPLPPCPEAFFQHGVVLNPRGLWHSKYYPGTALGLAALGPAFLPLAFALLLAAFYFVARRYVRETEARAAALLLGASPMMGLLAGSYMSHVPLLMWMAVAWAAAGHALARGRPAGAVLAGFAAGMGLLTRPLDSALLAGVIGLFLLCDPRFAWRRKGAALAWGLAGLAAPAALVLVQNTFLYGTPWTTGYNFSHSAAHYQIRVGLSDHFPLAQALRQGGWILARLNQALFGWPVSFVFVAWAFLAEPKRKSLYGLALLALGLYAPYFLYFYYGFEYEARYTFATVPFLCLLSAAGLRAFWRHPRWGWTAPGLLAAFFLYAAAYYWPAYLWPRYAHGYEEASAGLHRAALAAKLETPALVLLPDSGFLYSSGFIQNDPRLRNPVIYARDLPGQLPGLQAAFPDRRVYRYRPGPDPFRGDFSPVAPAP